MRFPRLIIEKIRERVGDRIAVLARINSSDEILGGNDVHDSAAIAACLEDYGVDALMYPGQYISVMNICGTDCGPWRLFCGPCHRDQACCDDSGHYGRPFYGTAVR